MSGLEIFVSPPGFFVPPGGAPFFLSVFLNNAPYSAENALYGAFVFVDII